MSKWQLEYSSAAKKDMKKLDGSQQKLVIKALDKVVQNPVAESEGGYGKPLGNHKDSKLSGCFKIKLRQSGIRIVYQLKYIGNVMCVIVIGMRAESEVYKEAHKRLKGSSDHTSQ